MWRRLGVGTAVIHISFEAPADPIALVVTERAPFPLARVWRAHTEALYLQHWWAPTDYVNVAVDFDPAPGRPWRISQRDPQGNEFAFYGRFDAVEPMRLISATFVSEIFADITTHLTIEFDASDDSTTITTTQVFPEEYQRTGYFDLGAIERLTGASKRLNALLKQMS